jgi:hypothetical protein
MGGSVQPRFFYHSFPRRGASSGAEAEKGKAILAAIRDFGLVLTPQLIEWTQATVSGTPRSMPILQRRVCFTELAPIELAEHADRFGHFSLEFEIETVRRLGAMPVFYVPQPTGGTSTDGSHMGAAIVAIATDLRAVAHRVAAMDEVCRHPEAMEKLDVNVGFAGSPDGFGTYRIDRDQTKVVLAAIGHAVTPWLDLKVGADALLNFFHPTDNTKTDAALEYYREREWRVACSFRINDADGKTSIDIQRRLAPNERERLLEIDREFFSRKVQTGLSEEDTLDLALVLPGLPPHRLIEMVRRVIVPSSSVADVTGLLATLVRPPPVVAL